MKRKALGKGLRSLIPQAPKPDEPVLEQQLPAPTALSPSTDPSLRQIDLDLIWPNAGQPRQEFDQAALEELARSMARDGVLQPVVVRPAKEPGHYELIAGERRWRAAQHAGLLKIPAVVRQVADDRVLELALIENLQREDLNPIETATAFRTLIDDMGLTQQEVGDRVGKDRTSIANSLRLLNLPPALQGQVKSGELSAGHARALLGVGSPDLQVRLAARVVREGLSVRRLEDIIKRLGSPGATSAGVIPIRADRDPNVVAAEEQLRSALGTKVAIVPSKKGGRVEIHYFSDEELQRLYQVLVGAPRRRSSAETKPTELSAES